MSDELIDKSYIMKKYKLSEYQSKKLVTMSKHELVAAGLSHYANRRVGKVPHYIVRSILGLNGVTETEIVRADEQSILNTKK